MPFVEVPEGDGDNLERAFSLRPEVYAVWRRLDPAFREPLTVGRPIESA